MTLSILGIGTSRPEYAISQDQAAEFALTIRGAAAEEGRRPLRAIYRRSGVERRASVLLKRDDDARQSFFYLPESDADLGPTTAERMQAYAESAPSLALRAANLALLESGVRPAEITHLVTASCTGFNAPGFDIELMRDLPLSPSVARTHLGFMGCHAALNALRVASALARENPANRVLVCALELCSLHFQYGGKAESVVSNALFADGAAALVGAHRPAASEGWRVARSGSQLFPDSFDAMSWRIGDHGFEMRLSPRVPQLIAQQLRPWLESWLAESGLRLADIGSWAIHPGGPRILSATRDALDLPEAADAVSRQVLSEGGNMSSPTLLFILQELRRRRAKLPCLALGFGPGLVAEVALIE